MLADEINRATPKTQSALLEAMQEHTVTVAKRTYPLDEPFFVLATQNPIEMEGTYPLPEAQLDRFMFKVNVELSLSRRAGGNPGAHHRPAGASAAGKAADGRRIVAMGRLARQIPVASHVAEYRGPAGGGHPPRAASAPPLVKQYLRYGASPRGGAGPDPGRQNHRAVRRPPERGV